MSTTHASPAGPRPRLPSLTALHAFEAAARLESFTRAGRELAVTQGAVSHQVRALEEALGLPLFVRAHRALALTPAGSALAAAARDAFDRLAAAVAGLRAGEARRLTVSVSPSFAAKWLLPRLPRFAAACPGIELRLLATQAVSDFARDGVDLAIRWGRGRYRGLVSEKLFGEEAFPVASPRLLRRRPLRTPADLRRHHLLHDEVGPAHGGWPAWLEAAGARGVDGEAGTRFSDAALLFQAALDGQGVALARSPLADDDLAAGRLVRPFATALPVRYHHAFVCPRRALQRPEVRAFRDFLVAEAGAGRAGRRAQAPR